MWRNHNIQGVGGDREGGWTKLEKKLKMDKGGEVFIRVEGGGWLGNPCQLYRIMIFGTHV